MAVLDGSFHAAISLFSTSMRRFLQSLLLGHVKTSGADTEGGKDKLHFTLDLYSKLVIRK